MITPDDLAWWLRTAPSLRWTFASTYAETAPHEYVVLGRNGCPLSRDDFVRAGKVVATFGRPAKFYSMTGIYLTSADGRLKWWTMDADLDTTDLINQATTDRVYGRQDAPDTATGVPVPEDAFAADYDRDRDPWCDQQLVDVISELFPAQSPTTLDIGCGTGRVLDLGVVHPSTYTGLDHSTAMLNMLVRKHPTVRRLLPSAWLRSAVADVPFALVTNVEGPVADLDEMRSLSSGWVVTARDGAVRIVRGTAGEPSVVAATVSA